MSGVFRSLSLLAALLWLALVAACTGPMPLYGTNAAVDVSSYSFSYGKPTNRSDQVIYRELRLRLPARPAASEVLSVSISSSTSSRALGRNGPYEMIATATATVTRSDGSVVFSGSRAASAGYGLVSQVLADNQAAVDAVERSSVAVAESLRLAILAALAR